MAVTDNFNRANGGLGGNWTTITDGSSPAPDPTINSNGVVPAAVGSSFDATSRYSAATFAADQYAKVVATTVNTATDRAVGVILRASSSAKTFYRILVRGPLGSGTATAFIGKVVAGSFTNLATVGGKTLTSGQTVFGQVNGSDLACRFNGTIVASVTDSAIASGWAGVDCFADTGAVTDAKLDDFEGGDLVTVTKTIGSSGRDYATIADWEADLDNTGIYHTGDTAVGEMYADSTFTLSAQQYIDGGGTVGLYKVILRAAAGQRHNGTANGSGVLILGTGGGTAFAVLNVGDVTGVMYELAWLNVKATADFFNNTNHVNVLSLGRGVVAHHNIVSISGTGPNSSFDVRGISNSAIAASDAVYNNIVHNITNTGSGGGIGILFGGGGGTILGWSNAVWGCSSYGIYGPAATLRDNISLGNGTAAFFDAGSPGSGTDYNLSDDASAVGAHSLQSVNSATVFVSTSASAENLHLKSGSPAINVGEDLSSAYSAYTDVTLDIDGYTRSGTWDIGADEFVPLNPLELKLAEKQV